MVRVRARGRPRTLPDVARRPGSSRRALQLHALRLDPSLAFGGVVDVTPERARQRRGARRTARRSCDSSATRSTGRRSSAGPRSIVARRAFACRWRSTDDVTGAPRRARSSSSSRGRHRDVGLRRRRRTSRPGAPTPGPATHRWQPPRRSSCAARRARGARATIRTARPTRRRQRLPARIRASADCCQRERIALPQRRRDCCSGRCEQGYCLPSSACSAPGVACSTRSSCCSGRCEPAGRVGRPRVLAVLPGRRRRGATTRASAARSGATEGCAAARCARRPGGSCMVDSQCCSAHCDGGRCAPAPAACLPTGEGCSDDGGATCCTGFCNPRTGRCDLGSGACREASSPCNIDSDCCMRPLPAQRARASRCAPRLASRTGRTATRTATAAAVSAAARRRGAERFRRAVPDATVSVVGIAAAIASRAALAAACSRRRSRPRARASGRSTRRGPRRPEGRPRPSRCRRASWRTWPSPSAALRQALDDAAPRTGDGTVRFLGSDRPYTWERGPLDVGFSQGRVVLKTHDPREADGPAQDARAPARAARRGGAHPQLRVRGEAPVGRRAGALVGHGALGRRSRRRDLRPHRGAHRGAAQGLRLRPAAAPVGGVRARGSKPIELPIGDAKGCARLRVLEVEAGPTVLADGIEKDIALVVAPSITLPCAEPRGRPARVAAADVERRHGDARARSPSPSPSPRATTS